MQLINGNVTAPKGFLASGIHCGIRKNTTKKDLALIYSEKECHAAAVYTMNLVKGAPILVTKENLIDGKAQAIICNSGNANTCNPDGYEKAKLTSDAIAKALDIDLNNVIIASTGVIGQKIDIDPILKNIPSLIENLSKEGHKDVSQAILTTDLVEKECAITFRLHDVPVTIGAIAKGSGMINPNMATMLSFITTDCHISSTLLHRALTLVCNQTYNMISIDGDTSTNDTVAIMANGLANNTLIETQNDDFNIFVKALYTVCEILSKKIAKDGEGATKLLECHVENCMSTKKAGHIAKSIIQSDLVKTAFFGADANWGRILCAIGYSQEYVDPQKIDVSFSSPRGTIKVCQDGTGLDFCETRAKEILLEDEITIYVNLKEGHQKSIAWGCDLTYDYVKINGDYRT